MKDKVFTDAILSGVRETIGPNWSMLAYVERDEGPARLVVKMAHAERSVPFYGMVALMKPDSIPALVRAGQRIGRAAKKWLSGPIEIDLKYVKETV